MYTQQNLESFQKQANDLANRWGQLLQQQPITNDLVNRIPPIPVVPPQIQYVNGMEGAREFLAKMPANGNAVLMDRNQALFYVVSKDANGNPAPIAFAQFELQTEQTPKEPEYATKQDLEELKEAFKSWAEGKK